MKKNLIFLLLAAVLLTPWPMAYAYDNATAQQSTIQIEVAAPASAPHCNAYGNAIGSVTPGDLFYINADNYVSDLLANLYITNTKELVHNFRYLTLNVGVYVQTDSNQWEKATTSNGEPLPDTYITMLNGKASFSLPGSANYKITIDKGCFYYYGTGTDDNGILPTFYLYVG